MEAKPKGACGRVSVLTGHLAHKATSATPSASISYDRKQSVKTSSLVDFTAPFEPRQHTLKGFLKHAEDRMSKDADLLDLLPGPMDDAYLKQMFPDFRDRVHHAIAASTRWPGKNMLYTLQLSEKYGGAYGRNIVTPEMLVARGNKPFLCFMVKILDHEDAQRVAARHVKKSMLYDNTFLRDGVLSVRDNDLWRAQREHLTTAFLPNASLAKIFPISLARATFALDFKLPQDSENFTEPVEMWEFWLNEAMAQLQLGLLGETPEFQELTNKRLRRAFGEALGLADTGGDLAKRFANQRKGTDYLLNYSQTLVERATDPVTNLPLHSSPSRDADARVHGPLTAQISTLKEAVEANPMAPATEQPVDRDTAATFLFAGHDTTANLMTWLTFEMARNPDLQQRLQAEIDTVFASLNGRDMTYTDLPAMTFLTRCITETLRLWPSVPNGTFRELETDERIKGRDGQYVTIPKGTNVQVGVWALHMNPSLWGADANEFNPDREFQDQELCGGYNGANPQSARFCPFTFNPRSCIGRNFAMMEARVLLSNFFHRYSVSLAGPTVAEADTARDPLTFMGKNAGTMGPGNGMYVNIAKRTQ
eukprot:m.214731 g.214731  ORF g.214731 m.214731 type:complete len:593 (-) comp19076_c0_seq1:348-2126(-)